METGQVNSIEAFIGQLHAEGVEAGKQEAERLRASATAQAAAIIANAEAAAGAISAEAEQKAQALLAEGRSELALAVRDAQLALRDALDRALTALLRKAVERDLNDASLVSDLLRDIVAAYARADGAGESLQISVRPELAEALTAAAPRWLGAALAEGQESQLKASLQEAGFEYRVRAGVVEVTPESVAEILAGLVTPQLRDLLQEAAGADGTMMPAGGAHAQDGAWTDQPTRAGKRR